RPARADAGYFATVATRTIATTTQAATKTSSFRNESRTPPMRTPETECNEKPEDEQKDEAHHAFLPHLALAVFRASAVFSSSLITELLELFECHDLRLEQGSETPTTIVAFSAKTREIAGHVDVASFAPVCVQEPCRPPVAGIASDYCERRV